jgi:hypothetical protein
MSDPWFGGANDAREAMISILALHDEGNVEAVSRQLEVVRVVEALNREIYMGIDPSNIQEAMRLYRVFARTHKRRSASARSALQGAIELSRNSPEGQSLCGLGFDDLNSELGRPFSE